MPLQCVKRIQNLWKERPTSAFILRERVQNLWKEMLTSAFTLRERVQILWKERLTSAFTMREKDTKLVEGEADMCIYSA